ncbi:TldD/PmbA family protein [Clostridium sp. 19966]|uniref:TldD/PmbA family protein n=1 Tax=Clostridium sp. 19966 TaxID=2768166 RepID=UPI0028DDA486|nr:TldD/PmbA family protein [Clostridium sp. 19966]MDT8717163.1 TldD/PmbA family protein [Clostridium sp. 19966]
MINTIKNILDGFDIKAYKIVEDCTTSEEVFLVKKDVDITRSKDVHHFKVTVYKDFTEGNSKFTGSAALDIHPTMTEAEIKKSIESGIFAAGFVKNEYYELPKGEASTTKKLTSNFAELPLNAWMPKIVDALYVYDTEEKGGINSTEIFLNKNYKRIVTSEGTDVSYESYDGMLEFVTNWKESPEDEEIELYKAITFSDFDADFIANTAKDMISRASARAKAKEAAPSGKYKVILTGGDLVKETLSYYYYKTVASAVYNKISTFEVGKSVQGTDITGDLINVSLDPTIKNSIHSVPFDNDGIALSPVSIIEDGVLKAYHGDLRHSYYLKQKPTGSIGNFIVKTGNKTTAEMKSEPYLELLTFSDFQMDPTTGDFGGEIRLGLYFDGNTVTPVTGGSLSANIQELEGNMHLSKESESDEGFVGPKSLEFYNVTIAGK